MGQISKKIGWLVKTASHAFGKSSCSNDDRLGKSQVAQQASPAIHVTVNASIVATTIGSAAAEGGNHTIAFSKGDKLYVHADTIEPTIILAGYLTIEDTLEEEENTSAKFSGDYGTDIKAYAWDADHGKYVATEHRFNTADILSECFDVSAVLVHSDANDFTVDDTKKYDYLHGFYASKIASTIAELTKRSLLVRGSYDAFSKCFRLAIGDDASYCTPIFNCNINGGLTPNATYTVAHEYGTDASSLYNHHDLGIVTASDVDGSVVFACYSDNVNKGTMFHCLRFTNTANIHDVKYFFFGSQALCTKIYDVTSSARAL